METMETFTPEYICNVKSLWEYYVLGQRPFPEHIPGLREEILDSWRRSRSFFVDQSSTEFSMLPEEELHEVLEKNRELIDVAHSYIISLSRFIKDTNFTIVLTDRDGCVIDTVAEDSGIMGLMRQTALRVGSVRNERITGTSGIATCLALDAPFQILGEEHYVQRHHTYFCTAVPIHDTSGVLIGCLAMVGSRELAHTHTSGMVYSMVDGIQKELQMRSTNSRLSFVNLQLQNMIQSLSTGVMLLDQFGTIVHHNDQVHAILGIPKSDPLDGEFLGDILSIASLPAHFQDMPYHNYEVTLVTRQGRNVDVMLTSVINSGKGTKEKSITLILEEQKYVRRLVQKISGFSAKYTFESIIGNSQQILAVKAIGQKAALSKANVLILGESGTGKELLAQSIHNASSRASGPFVAVNCGSIPKSLIESELFGYESGSFTGAKREGNPGKFELADGGTLFLDEIGDMPVELQSSLLRVLQNHEVIRLGGKHAKYVDVRVIAATNVNLAESMQNGHFRQDLYYRLNVISIQVPPLRQRPDDIPLLTDYFINTYSRSLHKYPPQISAQVQAALRNYTWPGNIRELENIIERTVNLTQSSTLELSDLPVEVTGSNTQNLASPPPAALHTSESTIQPPSSPEIRERDTILEAVIREKGHIKSVAEDLGIPLRTLYRKLQKYNIAPEDYRGWGK